MQLLQVPRNEAIVAHTLLWNLEHPTDLRSEDETGAFFSSFVEDSFEQTWIAKEADKLIASFVVFDTENKKPPQRLTFELCLDPASEAEHFPAVLDQMREVAKEAAVRAMSVWTFDTTPVRNQILECDGFKLIQSAPVTRLDLQAFDPAPFRDLLQRLESEGIRITTVSEIQHERPNWKRELFDATLEMSEDMPNPHERPVDRPFEPFAEMLENQRIWGRERMYVALDGERVVGYSRVSPAQSTPGLVSTGLSGTVRSHRRRGVVTALKVLAAERLKNQGYEFLQTDNDATNPMYQINLKLGFKPVWEYLHYEKQLVPAGTGAAAP